MDDDEFRTRPAVTGAVLVTGASGFIGRAVVSALAQSGRAVRAATRHPEEVTPRPGVVAVAVGDLARPIAWEPLLAGVDAVVHLAAIAHVGSGVASELYDRVNHQATDDLAAACVRAGVQRFVFMSSVRAQSGPASASIVRESDRPAPTEPYGRSKLRAETAVQGQPLAWTILRPTLVYGPGVKGNVASLTRLARLPVPLPFAGFTTAKRSLLGLDNLVSAVRYVLDNEDKTARRTFLVADGTPVNLAQIITALREGAGDPPRLFELPPSYLAKILRLLGRADLWDRLGGSLVVDTGELAAAGWRPMHDTEDGLRRLAKTQA
jgi:nucleoside-diphosphate-sugar epimerase